MMEDNLVPRESYDKIAKIIGSEESVVGIDAKETHIIIIHKLMEIEKRLDSLEPKIEW